MSSLTPAQLFAQQSENETIQAINGNNSAPATEVNTADPFPAFEITSSAPAKTQTKPLDISSSNAFPSLSGPSVKAPVSWGAGLKTKAAATPRPSTPDDNRASLFTETVSLSAGDIHVQALASKSFLDGLGSNRNRQPEPRTLGEVMKLLMKNHDTVKIEASTSRNVTTFIIKGTGLNAQTEV